MFLSLTNIKKSFGQGDSRVEVLKGIDLSIEKGEFCVLLGPSGSGKSTLLNIIGGIDRADSGQITIEGELMEKMTVKRLSQYRRKHLGYVFQMYNLIPNLTVRENIEVGAYLSDHALDVDNFLIPLVFLHIRRSCRISSPVASNSVLPLAGRLLKILIFCSVMSQPVRLIIKRRKKY